MFNRTSLLIVIAALAAGLGLWAGERWLQQGTASNAPATALNNAMQAMRLFPQPRPLPAFSLQGADGKPITLDNLLGRWTLVFLGFVSCPDVCPTTLQDLSAAQKQWQALPAANRPQLLFVSVDPERDTPEAIGKYAYYFHTDTIAGTQSDLKQLEAFATSLGMVFMKVPVGDSYTMDHSSILALIDPQGRQAGIVRASPAGSDGIGHFDAKKIAADLILLSQSSR